MTPRLVLVLLGVVLAGCGGGTAIDRVSEAPSCALRRPAASPSDTLTVVLFDTVDLSHAPWGRNREERFVFHHLYETLLTVDCRGQLKPGLAKRWLEASDGWLVELRDDARFWDDTPVTAQDVAAVIRQAIHDRIAIASVDVVDEHSLIIHGYRNRPDPKLLSLQMLAVTKKSDGSPVPVGSGAWVIEENVPVAEAIVIRPATGESPVVRFVQGNVSDARDILDGTADAMITDDPAAIEYARGKNAALAPLAWDRAYVLLSRSRAVQIEMGRSVEDLPAAVCDALARDAVSFDARGGSSIEDDAAHASTRRIVDDWSNMPSFSSDRPIVVASNDPVSRSLAERIVALASMDTSSSADARAIVRAVPGAGPGMRVLAAAPAEFASARRAGGGFAFVASLSWCSDFPHFVGDDRWAPWLYTRSSTQERVIPLVETRAHFIAMSDHIGYLDPQNGDIRILIQPAVMRR